MIGLKRTRLQIAKWLREHGIEGQRVALFDTFTLRDGRVVTSFAVANTWGIGNGLMKLEDVATLKMRARDRVLFGLI